MAIPNTLAGIREKVRRVTARTSTNQMTDATIDDYINTYYLYDLPESLRTLRLKDTYRFETQPNIEVYTLPLDTWMTFEPPAYASGEPMAWFQEPEVFYRAWPKINYIQQVSTGNGGTGPYTGTFTATPFLRSVNPEQEQFSIRNILITANISDSAAVIACDDGAGGFFDAVTGAALAGTINYATGAFSVQFATNVPAGTAINAEYIPYVASRPRSLLMFQSQIFLRPVPDKSYEIQMTGYRVPTSLINNADVPELAEWGQLLAYGAALKIFADYADFDQLNNVRGLYDEQLMLVNRRTINQLRNQRVATIYSEQNSYPFGNFYPYI